MGHPPSPICFDVIREAFITRCGHSFWYGRAKSCRSRTRGPNPGDGPRLGSVSYLCLVNHLEHRKSCPLCSSTVLREQIFPNFQRTAARRLRPGAPLWTPVDASSTCVCFSSRCIPVNRLVAKATAMAHAPVSPVAQLQQSLSQETLKVSDINALLNTLMDRKRRIEAEENEVETEILHEFLLRTRQEKEEVRICWSDVLGRCARTMRSSTDGFGRASTDGFGRARFRWATRPPDCGREQSLPTNNVMKRRCATHTGPIQAGKGHQGHRGRPRACGGPAPAPAGTQKVRLQCRCRRRHSTRTHSATPAPTVQHAVTGTHALRGGRRLGGRICTQAVAPRTAWGKGGCRAPFVRSPFHGAV